MFEVESDLRKKKLTGTLEYIAFSQLSAMGDDMTACLRVNLLLLC